jgi:hypothetical protein
VEKNFYLKIQNGYGRLVQDGVIFEKNIKFFQRGQSESRWWVFDFDKTSRKLKTLARTHQILQFFAKVA